MNTSLASILVRNRRNIKWPSIVQKSRQKEKIGVEFWADDFDKVGRGVPMIIQREEELIPAKSKLVHTRRTDYSTTEMVCQNILFRQRVYRND